MNTIGSRRDGHFPLEASAVDALLDCVTSPILLVRADESVIYRNSAAQELDAWIESDKFPTLLSAALAPALQTARLAGEQGPQTTALALSRSASEVRSFRATAQQVPTGSQRNSGAVLLVLAPLADGVDDASHPQVQSAQARLEDVQRQLLQADRMSSIGQLAAGVAHEINNPIGYIRSNLGTLAEYTVNFMRLLHAHESVLRTLRTLEPEKVRQIEEIRQQIDFDFLAKDLPMLLAESQEGIARVCKIVQDLRDFSRAGHDEGWIFADIHAGLDSTINIVWNELKYTVDLAKNYGSLPLIECLPSQLNQVFMNILVNAGQSIGDRGHVSVSTTADNHAVYVEISDTGNGIAEENLARIFEPFFTTKPIGKGTGFGLSISYGIVQKHGGKIDVRSAVGVGTTFLITLPIRQPHPVDNTEA